MRSISHSPLRRTKRNKMCKRTTLAALCVACALAFIPIIGAFADTSATVGDFTVTGDSDGYSYDEDSGLLTISGSGEYTITMASGVTTTSSDRIMVTSDEAVTITLLDVSITSESSSPFEIDATGDVTIKLDGTNTLKASGGYAGLQKTSTDNTLTITSAAGDGSTSGSLTATGGADGAGIGGGKRGDCSNITINGGTVTATGGTDGAGIGSGSGGDCSYITISGGSVTATCGDYGAGIGSGRSGDCSHITISGGTIKANGGYGGAGIGSGHGINVYGCYITINGGSVTATGGYNGAGIGGGYGGYSNDITINDGSVTATGGYKSAGIGGGCLYGGINYGNKITINGGSVTATGGYSSAGIGGGNGGNGSNITISGGYIDATAGDSASTIGSGDGGSTGTTTITGGYFADTDATTGEDGSVYSRTVASGYSVYSNVEDTKDDYPYVVLPTSQKYTVQWVNGDTTLQTVTDVAYDEIASQSYSGITPTKESTDESVCYYEFSWSSALSGTVFTYTATFTGIEHTWNDGEVKKEATCTEDGSITYTCTVCGETKTEAIDATGHTWNSGVVTKAATDTEDGVKTYTCTVCGETKAEVIDATASSTTTKASSTTTKASSTTTSSVTSITLNKTSATVTSGDTLTLTATISPSSSTASVTWSTSNTKIATVSSSGKVTTVGYGSVTITAKAGSKTATCSIFVEPDLDFTILGGSVRVSDPYGIRFGIQLGKSGDYGDVTIVEYGTLIIPTEKLGSSELATSTDSVLKVVGEKIYSETSSALVYTGVLINIPTSYFDTAISGRGYLIYKDTNGTQHTIYTDTVSRTFNGVAQSAYNSYVKISNPTTEQAAVLASLKKLLNK